MAHIRPEWAEHQRRRWMRHDAHRFLRQDWQRFLKPGADPRPLLSLFEGKANFNPSQPRVPARSPGGGRWTGRESQRSTDGNDNLDNGALWDEEEPLTRLAQLDNVLDDAGKPYYNRGGHHEIPRAVYEKWDLTDEVRRIFNKATTGTVPSMAIRMSPDGVPQGHFWRGPGSPHGIYNDAVEKFSQEFLARNSLPEDAKGMKPDQAYSILKEVRETQNPTIRNYNSMIRLLRRLFPVRTGRGAE